MRCSVPVFLLLVMTAGACRDEAPSSTRRSATSEAAKGAGEDDEFDTQRRNKGRRSSFDRTIAEKYTGELRGKTRGAESPEALARAWAEAYARRDQAAAADLILGLDDLPQIMDGNLELPKIDLVSSLLPLKEADANVQALRLGAFRPGRAVTIPEGTASEGIRLRRDLEQLEDSRLEVTLDGKPWTLVFLQMTRADGRWKLSDTVQLDPQTEPTEQPPGPNARH